MFTSSQDILNLVLSISVAVLTIFLSLAIYYIIASVKRAFRLVKNIERGIEKLEDLIDLAKSKLNNTASQFFILVEFLKQGMELIKNRSNFESSKKKTSETKTKAKAKAKTKK